MTKIEISRGVATVLINTEQRPVNMWGLDTASEFARAVDQLLADDALKGIIVTSPREEFMVGADIAELTGDGEHTWTRVAELGDALNTTFRKMETSELPIVAAINGTALGGGYELCLACKYRIALDSPRVKLGLPEVKLGLIPGAGGTQRLPRLIGIANALKLMTEGRIVAAPAALEMGLVDSLATDRKQLLELARQWIEEHPRILQRWEQKGFTIPGGGVQTAAGHQTFAAGNAMLAKKTKNNLLAPRAIMSAAYQGLQLPIDRGVEIETRYFLQCLRSPQTKATMRTFFFGLNSTHKGRARPQGCAPHKVSKVSVLGAGMMGGGIAYACSKVGIDVVLKDIDQDAAQRGKSYSQGMCARAVKRRRLTQQQAEAQLQKIHPTEQICDLADSDLIIEAVTEDRGIKEKVIREAESYLKPSGFMSSNTSTLPITGLAEYSQRPQHFVGLHFFSPVDKMPLVEIIRGRQTSDEAVAQAFDFVRQLGKTPIIVNDGWGFYTSRVFKVYVNEGLTCLSDGVAPALIENAGQMAGMPVGPLAVADEVGLDLFAHIIRQKEADTQSADDSPPARVIKLFVQDLQRQGRKSKAGFYEYLQNQEKFLWPELPQHFKLQSEQPDVALVEKRLLYAQALEAAKVLQEGILTSPLDGDIGSVMGWGFAAHTGGVFSFIDQVGIQPFVNECQAMAKQIGSQFEVPSLLLEMAQDNQKFYP